MKYIYNPELPIYDAVQYSQPTKTGLIVVGSFLFLLIVGNLFGKIEEKSFTVLVISLTLTFAICLYFYWKQLHRIKEFMRNASRTTGTIVGKGIDDRNDDEDLSYRCYLFYQFLPHFTMRVELKINKIHTTPQLMQYFNQFKEGDAIAVFFQTTNPQINVPDLPQFKHYKLF
jgi:hypothetical protein